MANLGQLNTAIRVITHDKSISDIPDRINEAVSMISGGVRMPDGQVTPPLPELYEISTVETTVNAYADLPDTYQRKIVMVIDSSGDEILPVNGGDLYAFKLFINSISEKNLSETGSIYRACVKGKKLYYQGIPSDAETLTLHFYRLPVDMADNDDTPDGLPTHLSKRLIVHYVCAQIYGEMIESGEDTPNMGHDYHLGKFYTAMTDLLDFIGDTDSEPLYMAGGTSFFADGGVCD